MRHVVDAKAGLWACALTLSCLLVGCPDTSAGVDAAGDTPAPQDLANDLTRVDAGMDSGVDDVPTTRCTPGMSIACACTDGRRGAQVCLGNGTYGECACAAPVDAGTADAVAPDVVLPPLPARLIAPQSVSRVTSQRPTMRWVLPDGVTRAHVDVCGDRACTRVLAQQDVTGTSWRPTVALPPGVAWWRVRGLGADGGVAWSSATWEFVVGRRDAPVDTSFGTIKDFNGDGYDDIATTSNDGGYDHVNILNGRATMGSTEFARRFETTPYHVYVMGSGDFNGDGFADLVFTPIEEGIVQVRYGSAIGLSHDPSLRLSRDGNRPFASSLAVGDVDGDGFSDLIVASVLAPGTYPARFEWQVFRGGVAGLAESGMPPVSTPAGYATNPPSPGAFKVIGDVNADGYADLLTTNALFADSRGGQAGIVWLVAGHPSLPMHAWTVLDRPTTSEHFGGEVAGVGDLDGDGVADFAIRSNEEVSIYLGVPGLLRTTPTTTLRNPERGCYVPDYGFGEAIGQAGDYNGDGRADLAVGSHCLPYLGGLRPGVGSAFIYMGQAGGVSATALRFRGMYPDANFGVGLGGIGDFNADGFGDLAVLQADAGSSDPETRASINVFVGSVEGLSASPVWTYRTIAQTFFQQIVFLSRTSRIRWG